MNQPLILHEKGRRSRGGSMKVRRSNAENGIVLIEPEGELDYHHSTELREALVSEFDQGHKKMAVGLAGVPYMDSSAIAAFVEISQRLKTAGGRLVFFGMTDPVRKVFELARLHLFFTLSESRDEALSALGS